MFVFEKGQFPLSGFVFFDRLLVGGFAGGDFLFEFGFSGFEFRFMPGCFLFGLLLGGLFDGKFQITGQLLRNRGLHFHERAIDDQRSRHAITDAERILVISIVRDHKTAVSVLRGDFT